MKMKGRLFAKKIRCPLRLLKSPRSKYLKKSLSVPSRLTSFGIITKTMSKIMLSTIGALSFLGCVSQQTETNRTDAQPSAAIAPAATATPERTISLELDSSLKTKVTNVDVVKRHPDRSEMTIGIEYEYREEIPNAKIGVEILLESSPGVSRFFESRLADVGRRRTFALFDVKFRPPPQA
jgi:hypothetical protein